MRPRVPSAAPTVSWQRKALGHGQTTSLSRHFHDMRCEGLCLQIRPFIGGALQWAVPAGMPHIETGTLATRSGPSIRFKDNPSSTLLERIDRLTQHQRRVQEPSRCFAEDCKGHGPSLRHRGVEGSELTRACGMLLIEWKGLT
mmetsp:Transcript_23000/g.39501  ORF Transcript_23000/g.39501 Transcript_23000/m.39501 type:complete len:143 (+) Transcript_23000:259-687(+)